jgi:Fe2+ transport system protein FeoA
MKTYDVIDVPANDPCDNCTPCLRLRLMDMGFIAGQKIELEEKRLGLWIVNMISENGNEEQTFALRPEELDRICLKEIL